MNAIQLHSLVMLHLLWLVPVLVFFFIFVARRRRRALELFVDAGLLDRMSVSSSVNRRRAKAVLTILAVLFIVLGLTRPAWNLKPQTVNRRGRDLVFILDVSRSMLAEDLVPSRLERAKLAILDCVERLEGDRIGLVIFAGNALVKCPLTLDYGFFRMMLNDVSVDSVSRGGTMIGDALRKALDEAFDDQEKQHKDIILITDGEDHDSFPIEAARHAGERGIRLIAIGLGDENQGRRIPVTNEQGQRAFLSYHGDEVWSRLDADTLRKMVDATEGGKYLNVSTGTIDLGNVYFDLIASAEKRALESTTIERYEEKFQVFLLVALTCLIAAMVIGERKKR